MLSYLQPTIIYDGLFTILDDELFTILDDELFIVLDDNYLRSLMVGHQHS